jgi:hypothetical protein
MEKRKSANKAKSSPLPHDYLTMVQGIYSTHFDEGLKKLGKLKKNPRFEATGEVFLDEVLLCVSLSHEGSLAATSVYASCDFDPKASSPTAQDLLAACVDAIGALYGKLFEPSQIEQLAQDSLSAFEDVPFEWSPVDVERFRVYLKVDKANPKLDQMADDWLKKNDRTLQSEADQEQQETESLFVTGPSRSKPTKH